MTRTLTLFLIISNISGEAFMLSWLKGPRRSKSFLTWLQRPGWSSPAISEPFTCSSTSIFENFQMTCFDLTNFYFIFFPANLLIDRFSSIYKNWIISIMWNKFLILCETWSVFLGVILKQIEIFKIIYGIKLMILLD